MQLPNELREVSKCHGINLGEERRVQRRGRAAEQLSVEENARTRARTVPVCSLLSGQGQGRAQLALGATRLCGEGSRANQETGPGREGCLPV